MGNVIDVKYLQSKFKKALNNSYIDSTQYNEMSYYIDDFNSFKSLILSTMYDNDVFDDTFSTIDNANRCLTFSNNYSEIDIDMCAWDTFFTGDDESYMAGCEYTYLDDESQYNVKNLFYGTDVNRVLDESSVQTTWDNDFHIICVSPSDVYYSDNSDSISRATIYVWDSSSNYFYGTSFFNFTSEAYSGHFDITPQMRLVTTSIDDIEMDLITPAVQINVSGATGMTLNSEVEIDGNFYSFKSMTTGATNVSAYPVRSTGYLSTYDISLDDIKHMTSLTIYPDWEYSGPSNATWTIIINTNAYLQGYYGNEYVNESSHYVSGSQVGQLLDDCFALISDVTITSTTTSSTTGAIYLTVTIPGSLVEDYGTDAEYRFIRLYMTFGRPYIFYIPVYAGFTTQTISVYSQPIYIEVGSEDYGWTTDLYNGWSGNANVRYPDNGSNYVYDLSPDETYATEYTPNTMEIEVESGDHEAFVSIYWCGEYHDEQYCDYSSGCSLYLNVLEFYPGNSIANIVTLLDNDKSSYKYVDVY